MLWVPPAAEFSRLWPTEFSASFELVVGYVDLKDVACVARCLEMCPGGGSAAGGLEVWSWSGERKVVHPAGFLFTVLSLFLGVGCFRACTAYCCCFSQSGFPRSLSRRSWCSPSVLSDFWSKDGKHSAFCFQRPVVVLS